jgi:hypothetical protein
MYGVIHLYLRHLNEAVGKKEQDVKDDEGHQDAIRFGFLL